MNMEEKVAKTSNKSKLIIILAILIIGAGVVFMVTGSRDQKGNSKKEDEVNETNKGTQLFKLSDEEARVILQEMRDYGYPEANWTIKDVKVIAYGNNNSYLISYTHVEGKESTALKTIITVELDASNVLEFPGWSYERDLTEYEFKYDRQPLEND